MYNLCCISNDLKAEGYSFMTMTWKRFNQLRDEHGVEYALSELGERWCNNVGVTLMAIKHCHNNGWGYRVSSALFPCLTHPDFEYDISDVPQYNKIIELFQDIASYNQAWQVRLSTHPDQFNVLASDNANAVHKTIKELNHHGWIMDMLGCERNHNNPINIHVNCTNGDLSDIASRFMSNLSRCDASVQTRLVVENEDKGCWTVTNLLDHFDLPVTFDNLHDKCNPSDGTMEQCSATWFPAKPLFHYSESHPDKTNPRSHADMPTSCPPCDSYDWDIELKSKDDAIRACCAVFA